MAKLNANTVVIKDYSPVSLYAGDEIPEWAADQVGRHLLTVDPEGDASVVDSSPDAPEPKAPGRRTAAK